MKSASPPLESPVARSMPFAWVVIAGLLILQVFLSAPDGRFYPAWLRTPALSLLAVLMVLISRMDQPQQKTMDKGSLQGGIHR